MPDVKWTIKGREYVNCNCSYGCPCQFSGLPTHGNCHAVLAVEIQEGHHGDVSLDGLKVAAVAAWPGAIHEGRGQIQPVVDERATPEQRNALLRIMSGQDTEPGATMFQVYSTTFEKIHDPVFTRIEFNVDVDGREATLKASGIIDGHGEPIRNPITGKEHRARINLPDGFEYTTAEIGRGWATARGPIELNISDSYAQFAPLHLTQSGVVH